MRKKLTVSKSSFNLPSVARRDDRKQKENTKMKTQTITSAVSTKTITVFATSRANIEPGRKGYILSLVDPDADSAKPLNERTFASGYAVPVSVEVPSDWTIGEAKYGITYLWAGKTPMQLAWYHNKGTMAAWPAFATFDEAKERGALTNLKAQKLNAVG